MNLTKSREYFDPDKLTDSVHIIGVGAVGSTIAENLCRHGVAKFHLWDYDTVDEYGKNTANQMYLPAQAGMPKVDAMEEILKAINPDVVVTKHGKYTNEKLDGYVFMCPDSIAVRQAIVKSNIANIRIKAMFDGRMRLTDAQHFACSAGNQSELLKTMDFSDEEAKDETPKSACGETLSLATTVRLLGAAITANFINLVVKGKLNKTTLIDLHSDTIIQAWAEG